MYSTYIVPCYSHFFYKADVGEVIERLEGGGGPYFTREALSSKALCMCAAAWNRVSGISTYIFIITIS
jgi:hypothetical protein